MCLEILKLLFVNPVWPGPSPGLLGIWQRDEVSDLYRGSPVPLPGKQPRQTALQMSKVPEGGSHCSSWVEPMITLFDSNHWVGRVALFTVNIPAAGKPVLSVAITTDGGIKYYQDTLPSWESTLIRTS